MLVSPPTHAIVEEVQGIILSRLNFISLVMNTRALQTGFCLRYILKRPVHGFSFAVQGRHLLRDTVISTASMVM